MPIANPVGDFGLFATRLPVFVFIIIFHLQENFIMGRKRMSSRQREGVSKRKKDIQDYQEESNTVENETWQATGSIYSSEKEKELVKKEVLAIDSSEKERESFKKLMVLV
ncbi:hypothetical protein Ddye_011441 [Dipteronia dyeriana]|uniref:Uncharacterized protein n=1 Tax=Dipteronia dyeriana TaxID=168575 RepID=A0AAD9X2I3_9ROSI|nr:hypothetical protein Ddye_011441 [Dipteronia dyeriana]